MPEEFGELLRTARWKPLFKTLALPPGVLFTAYGSILFDVL